ncbi:acyl-CoA dehydrogenase precursor [Moelleriella libera RCEF 2490]|uniref:Short/branched chain specific acyl-CoA dehydrogenase, mitochondrial n=1 Tax=Moelleriella libera RCEF 2490 TaxID=1081109 RepID=A0A166PAF9_9HYPO|nr:acyl-CoA dehydrogenase precursor [Moelleriella libera RCEF 2490]
MSSLSRVLRPALRLRGASVARCAVSSRRPVAHSKTMQVHPPPSIFCPTYSGARPLSATAARRSEAIDITDVLPTPISHLSEVEAAMAESVSKFASEVILPRAREMDEAEDMDPAIVQQLFDQGLMGVEIPEEYGGAGMNFTAAIVGIEELARADPSVSVLVDVHNTLCNTAVLNWGSEALKKKWLPRLATDTVASFCLSEPVSGSDAFALATRAHETSDGFTINGGKMWITNSKEAGFFIVFANLDPAKGYRGITAFVVEKGTPGFTIAKKEKKLGIRASSTCVLTFDDVHVPKENLLGERGHGYKYAIGLLNEGRIGIAAQMTGLALGAFENAVRYVWNDRKQFGSLVGEFQGMQHQIAQSWTEIAAARALVYNAARKKEAGEDFVRDAAMAKLYSSQVAGRVSGLAIEWMGGMGFVREGLAEKYWRDSKIGAIYEGTSNIQLNTIAKLLQKEYTT